MLSQAQDQGTHTIYDVVQINLVISTHRGAGMLLADTNEDTDYTVYKCEEAGAARVGATRQTVYLPQFHPKLLTSLFVVML